MKDFMKSVISKSVVGEQDVRVGIMQYSTEQQIEFRLNSYYTKDEIFKAIDGIQQMGGGTHTGEAIRVVSQYFDADRGGRPHVRQRLVVITDGESQDEVKGPALAVRTRGVVVYAIGVMGANTTQLLEISGLQERMYAERDFDALKDLESKVALEVCEPERGRNFNLKQKHFFYSMVIPFICFFFNTSDMHSYTTRKSQDLSSYVRQITVDLEQNKLTSCWEFAVFSVLISHNPSKQSARRRKELTSSS